MLLAQSQFAACVFPKTWLPQVIAGTLWPHLGALQGPGPSLRRSPTYNSVGGLVNGSRGVWLQDFKTKDPFDFGCWLSRTLECLVLFWTAPQGPIAAKTVLGCSLQKTGDQVRARLLNLSRHLEIGGLGPWVSA